jgi:hypothetical protein
MMCNSINHDLTLYVAYIIVVITVIYIVIIINNKYNKMVTIKPWPCHSSGG